MLWIICTIIFLGGGAAAWVVSRKLTLESERRYTRFGAIAAVVIWFVITFFAMVVTVDSGKVTIIRQFGEIVGQADAGVNFILPWQSAADEVSIRTESRTFENLEAASSDTQDVFVTITINYAVSEADAQDLVEDFGSNWFDVLVPSRVRNHTKATFATYPTVNIIPSRDAIRDDIATDLIGDLEDHNVIISDVLIDNIAFSDEYMLAIEQRQVATETARKDEEMVAAFEFQGDQREAAADADAAVTRTNAQAQADANDLINASLTPELLQWQAIQALGDNVEIIMLPSGQGFILDLSTMPTPAPVVVPD